MISDTRMPTAADARVAEIQLLLHCECVDWLTSQPTAHSKEQQCFENVAQHIQKHQGTAQLGYNVCVSANTTRWTAIQHCVWQDAQGLLTDITPVTSVQLYTNCFIWSRTAKKLFHNVFFDTVIVNYNYPIQRRH